MHDDNDDGSYKLPLFERPVNEWTDDEIRAGLAVLGTDIEGHRLCDDLSNGTGIPASLLRARLDRDTDLTRQQLTELAIPLAAERDRRKAVYRQAESAMADVVVTAVPLGILPD